MWDTDMTFLPLVNNYSLVTCTAYSDVREYDLRGQRKAVLNQ